MLGNIFSVNSAKNKKIRAYRCNVLFQNTLCMLRIISKKDQIHHNITVCTFNRTVSFSLLCSFGTFIFFSGGSGQNSIVRCMLPRPTNANGCNEAFFIEIQNFWSWADNFWGIWSILSQSIKIQITPNRLSVLQILHLPESF